MNWKDAKDRKSKTREAPQVGIALDLNILLAAAQKLGGIQGACLAHKISWAAFYTEKKKFDLLKMMFLSNLKIEVTHAQESKEAQSIKGSEQGNPSEAVVSIRASKKGRTGRVGSSTIKARKFSPCPNCGRDHIGICLDE